MVVEGGTEAPDCHLAVLDEHGTVAKAFGAAATGAETRCVHACAPNDTPRHSHPAYRVLSLTQMIEQQREHIKLMHEVRAITVSPPRIDIAAETFNRPSHLSRGHLTSRSNSSLVLPSNTSMTSLALPLSCAATKAVARVTATAGLVILTPIRTVYTHTHTRARARAHAHARTHTHTNSHALAPLHDVGAASCARGPEPGVVEWRLSTPGTSPLVTPPPLPHVFAVTSPSPSHRSLTLSLAATPSTSTHTPRTDALTG